MDHDFMNIFGDLPRISLPVPSTKSQTILAKALFEHVCDSAAVIAVTALASKSIQNSSLAANCATNFWIDEYAILLFDTVFNPASALSAQFTPSMYFQIFFGSLELTPEFSGQMTRFVSSLVNSNYFTKSLRCMSIESGRGDFIWFFLRKNFGGIDGGKQNHQENETDDDDSSTVVVTFPNLEHLCIKDYDDRTSEHITALLKSSPGLKTIELSQNKKLELKDINQLTIAAPSTLISLKLPYASEMDDGAVELISRRLGDRLNTLILTSCNAVTASGFAHLITMKKLASLDLSWSRGVGDEAMAHFGTIPSLTSLNLEGCTKISDQGVKNIGNSLVAENLIWLNLKHCSRITSVGFVEGILRLVNLTNLNVGHCFRIEDEAFATIEEQLSRLEVLNLKGLHGLTMEGIGSHLAKLPKLRVLTVYRFFGNNIKRLLHHVTELNFIE